MNLPEELSYTSEHEWVSIDGDLASVGITDYAQGELGDIVFIELPKPGDKTVTMEPFGTIEAVKAVSDLYAPLTGEVVEVNGALEDQPELINNSPYEDGWIMKLRIADKEEVQKLLSVEEYQSLIE